MKTVLVLCLGLLLVRVAVAQQLRVAAAADLAPSMNEIKQAFEEGHEGSKLIVSIGSSVQLETQIENGAPFDVFLSADMEQPQKLIDGGKAEQGTLYEYARGILALLVPANQAAVQTLQELASDSVRKIAIANPSHAPYGRAAVAALKSSGLYDSLRSKLVEGENVAQTAQFVISGNADAGLVSMSAKSAAGPDFKTYPVDPSLYPPIRQGAVLTKAGAHNAAARDFLEFLHSDKAQKILQDHGLNSSKAVFRPVR